MCRLVVHTQTLSTVRPSSLEVAPPAAFAAGVAGVVGERRGRDHAAELANSAEAMHARCPRGFSILLRRGWQFGQGLGRELQGLLEPVPYKNARFVSARSHQCPNLGLGHPMTLSADDHRFGGGARGGEDSLASNVMELEAGVLAEAAREFAPKWVRGGVMAAEQTTEGVSS